MTSYIITYSTDFKNRLKTVIEAATYTMAMLAFVVKYPPERYWLVEIHPS